MRRRGFWHWYFQNLKTGWWRLDRVAPLIRATVVGLVSSVAVGLWLWLMFSAQLGEADVDLRVAIITNPLVMTTLLLMTCRELVLVAYLKFKTDSTDSGVNFLESYKQKHGSDALYLLYRLTPWPVTWLILVAAATYAFLNWNRPHP